MRVSEIDYEGPRPIDSYGGGGFRIAGAFHEGGLVKTPEAMARWPVRRPSDMTEADFAPVLAAAGAIDVLLVGMGEEIAALPGPIRAALEGAGIGVEAMSTASACRTYNVLLAEDRRVAAALIAV